MLYQSDTDILFPHRAIPALRHLRGVVWQQLVTQICENPDETHPDVLAFLLFMIHHNGCLQCHPHSFRAMRGCTLCAQQSIERHKGTDESLIQAWQLARDELSAQA